MNKEREQREKENTKALMGGMMDELVQVQSSPHVREKLLRGTERHQRKFCPQKEGKDLLGGQTRAWNWIHLTKVLFSQRPFHRMQEWKGYGAGPDLRRPDLRRERRVRRLEIDWLRLVTPDETPTYSSKGTLIQGGGRLKGGGRFLLVTIPP